MALHSISTARAERIVAKLRRKTSPDGCGCTAGPSGSTSAGEEFTKHYLEPIGRHLSVSEIEHFVYAEKL